MSCGKVTNWNSEKVFVGMVTDGIRKDVHWNFLNSVQGYGNDKEFEEMSKE